MLSEISYREGFISGKSSLVQRGYPRYRLTYRSRYQQQFTEIYNTVETVEPCITLVLRIAHQHGERRFCKLSQGSNPQEKNILDSSDNLGASSDVA